MPLLLSTATGRTGEDGKGRHAGQHPRLGAGSVTDLVATCAATLGIDPAPFTLRELYAMYIERGIYDWRQTAAIVTMIYMAAPAKKKKMDPESINPYILLKRQAGQKRKPLSLAAIARLMPGLRIIDKRTTENQQENIPCR
jgi:hypothetical protein